MSLKMQIYDMWADFSILECPRQKQLVNPCNEIKLPSSVLCSYLHCSTSLDNWLAYINEGTFNEINFTLWQCKINTLIKLSYESNKVFIFDSIRPTGKPIKVKAKAKVKRNKNNEGIIRVNRIPKVKSVKPVSSLGKIASQTIYRR